MKRHNKILLSMLIGTTLLITTSQSVEAQIPLLDIIKAAMIKVIKAIDLKVQRIQTKTIWLQNAQKVLENKLSKFKLDEIAQWTEKQRQLYKKYYDELWKVRNTLATYHRIALILQRQKQLVQQYKFTWQMVNQDKHFSRSEIDYMYLVYTGIINQSVYNLDELMMVINSDKTQMTDAKRLEVINKVGDNIDRNYTDLQQFNNQNTQLSINRSKDENEIKTVKRLCGLPTQ
ncbi:MAG: Conjugative transposon protein TraI [Cytophagales bacterium]|nr:conjugal transfer protein TraI [Bacteroidota bacterium]MBS1950709.1 conjugal transfer protein TraI [Bacteroidota bacterium]MBS1980731.1 conjugal transfer protein TraI [Bacteroidota bacterium]WHZ08068.1 MAG: Conjugative transposon protein TraI [Cytophagales bacterium]